MRHPRLSSTHVVAAALVIAGVFATTPVFAQAQPPAQAPAPAPTPPLGPYKPVAITLPPSVNDPSFEAFRKQLAEIANSKDRAALARLVAANFFWVPEEKDIADKQKSGIDNLAKALSLDGTDGFGWEALAAYAAETTVMADPQRKGVFCAPAEPVFDEKAADELANVLTAGGKVGYVPIDTILPIGGEQLCYLKDAGTWKIAGFLGGEPNH